MASFNSAMPSTFVYFEALPLSIAFTAACLILSGVSKSGSPAPRPITLRPASLSARALSVTAMVADGLMRWSWSARKAIEILLCRSAAYIPVVMRTAESSKGRFVKEIRSIRSVLPIILARQGTQRFRATGFRSYYMLRAAASIIFRIRVRDEASMSPPKQYGHDIGRALERKNKISIYCSAGNLHLLAALHRMHFDIFVKSALALQLPDFVPSIVCTLWGVLHDKCLFSTLSESNQLSDRLRAHGSILNVHALFNAAFRE